MTKIPLKDPEVNENQLIYKYDFFDRLLELITMEIEPPFSLSIEGEWGSGKTFILKLLENKLRAKGYPTIWFNPWEYERTDDVFLAFLKKLSQKFKEGDLKEIIKNFGIFGISLFACSIDTFARLISGGQLSYRNVREIVNDVEKKFPESFKEFDDITQKIKKDFRAITTDIFCSKKKPIIIFFDDLDRCLPENTLSIIELLKNYFNVKGAKAIFIFGQNPSITREFIKKKYPKISTKFIHDYYKKIFDLCISLPHICNADISIYLKHKFGNFFDDRGINQETKELINSYNINFHNHSIRTLDKVIYNYIFYHKISRNTNNEFLLFWCFSKEVYPHINNTISEYIIKHSNGKLGDIESCIKDLSPIDDDIKNLYLDFIRNNSKIKNKILQENLI